MELEDFLKAYGIKIVTENINKPVEEYGNSSIRPTVDIETLLSNLQDGSRIRSAVDIEALISSLQGSKANSIKIVFVSEVETDDDIAKRLEYDAIECIIIGEYSLAIKILEGLL